MCYQKETVIKLEGNRFFILDYQKDLRRRKILEGNRPTQISLGWLVEVFVDYKYRYSDFTYLDYKFPGNLLYFCSASGEMKGFVNFIKVGAFVNFKEIKKSGM